MNPRIVEKFFKNTCTAGEAKRVLEWLDTPEGQKYLDGRLDSEIEQVSGANIQPADIDLDSEKLFGSIQEKLKSTPGKNARRRRHFDLTPVLRMAAVLLLGFTGSLFYYFNYYEAPESEQIVNSAPKHYVTGEDQQRELTLTDGTKIRLNSNSQVWIPERAGDTREVRMEGEAYFDVTRNPEKPFIIHTDNASIQVLGTAFNVKSSPSKSSVQVAVVEGSVSFSSSAEQTTEESVILEKGQFGYLNEDKITIEEFGVENYLAWMRGRLVFEDLALSQVCVQLTRLYDVQCGFDDEALKELLLSTNISDDSFEKVLSVISLSLDISYRKDGSKITWFSEEK